MSPELLNKMSRNINRYYYDTRIFSIRINLQVVKCNNVLANDLLFLNDDSTKEASFIVMIHNGIIS
jgi:hypothetical protein